MKTTSRLPPRTTNSAQIRQPVKIIPPPKVRTVPPVQQPRSNVQPQIGRGQRMNRPEVIRTPNRVQTEITTTAVEDPEDDDDGENKCYRIAGYFYLLPYIIVLTYFIYTSIYYSSRINPSIHLKIEEVGKAENLMFYDYLMPYISWIVRFQHENGLYYYLAAVGIQSFFYSLLIFFILSMALNRQNQHVYTSFGICNLTSRKIARALLRSQRGISCILILNSSQAIVNLPFLFTSGSSMDVSSYSNYSYLHGITSCRLYGPLIQPFFFVYMLYVSVSTILIKKYSTRYPDVQNAFRSSFLGGILFWMTLPFVIIMVVVGMSTFIGTLVFYVADFLNSGWSTSDPKVLGINILWIASRICLIIMLVSPLVFQTIQWSAYYCCKTHKKDTYDEMLKQSTRRYIIEKMAEKKRKEMKSHLVAIRKNEFEKRKQMEIHKKKVEIERKYHGKEANFKPSKFTYQDNLNTTTSETILKTTPRTNPKSALKSNPNTSKKPIILPKNKVAPVNIRNDYRKVSDATREGTKKGPQARGASQNKNTTIFEASITGRSQQPNRQIPTTGASSTVKKNIQKYTPGKPTKMLKPNVTVPKKGPVRVPDNYQVKNKRFQT